MTAGRRRRRRVAAVAAVAGTGLLGASLSTEPGSAPFYLLTGATAATWAGGGIAAGPLPRGRSRHPVLIPVATGAAVFGVFYAGALVSLRIPLLRRAISSVLRYSEGGTGPLVALTTLANGAAEEIFFRGAVYAAAGERRPVLTSTAVYMLATTATRNPALVLAAGAVGAVSGLQRRATGGIQAPMLTHLTWSALMLRFLPPLFRDADHSPVNSRRPASSRSTSVSST